MVLSEGSVRAWARAHDIDESDLQLAEQQALIACTSRLLQALQNESRLDCPTNVVSSGDGLVLELGRGPVVEAPIGHGLPFGRVELSGLPAIRDSAGSETIRTANELLTSVSAAQLIADPIRMARLGDDFLLSYWNVVLNHLLKQRLDGCAFTPPEPVHLGHQYYPFPGLRDGPDPEMISSCSNLASARVAVPIFRVPNLTLVSTRFRSVEQCMDAIAAGVNEDPTILIHPWQLELSDTVRGLVSLGLIRDGAASVEGSPLASQRTIRLATGFDVKLPVAATLTGEHRLIMPTNRVVSQFTSICLRELVMRHETGDLEFQDDLAVISHPDPKIGCHLSMIVRETPQPRSGEFLLSAVNAWSTGEADPSLWRVVDREGPESFLSRYVRAIADGPIRCCLEWGLALEPHMQNTILRFDSDGIAGVVIRDLDGTILNRRSLARWTRWPDTPQARALWKVMPSYALGVQRLWHALVSGHLACVVARLHAWFEADPYSLGALVESELDRIVMNYAKCDPDSAGDLRADRRLIRQMLTRRLSRATSDSFAASR